MLQFSILAMKLSQLEVSSATIYKEAMFIPVMSNDDDIYGERYCFQSLRDSFTLL